MKNIKKSLLYMFLLTVMLLAIPTQASAAVKLNKKTVTLTVGKSVTLKLKGTKKKAKWSSSKKSVATVNSKGKVTAKKKGTTTITAKIGKKKYTCKVTVKKKTKTLQTEPVKIVQNNPIQAIPERPIETTPEKPAEIVQEEKPSVEYKDYKIEGGVVIIVKNNSNYAVEVIADCIFYRNGNMVAKASDYDYALEAGRECALRAYNFDDNWDSYTINMKVEKETNIVGNAQNIAITSNYGNENVMATVINNGQSNEFTKIAIVFYSGGKVIGYDEAFADVDNKGDIDYLEFMFPFGYDFKTIVPDSYRIYVNSSYRYSWN